MNQVRPVIFGEVLFDCFDDGTEVLGGAPFNVAWHLQAFGLHPAMISRVGNDRRGAQVLRAMNSWGMDTHCIQVDPARQTGEIQITMTNGEPVYTISPEDAWGYIDEELQAVSLQAPLLYHGSLALYNQQARKNLEQLKEHCAAPVFLDVNLRDPWWRMDAIQTLIQGADWVKLNHEELSVVMPEVDAQKDAVARLLQENDLTGVIVTQGKEGATVYQKDGSIDTVTPEQGIHAVDTVGAGDAFCSVFILGLISGWPVETTLQRAQDFASAIVGQRGATVDDAQFYTLFMKKWLVS